MSLIATIQKELTTAMKEREAERRDALRLILSSLQSAEKELQRPLTEDEELQVLQRERKRRLESIEAFVAAGRAEQDPLWQLPLWQPYMSMLDSRLADLVNGGPSRHAGAITAALFLQRFVPKTTPWLHVDAYAWNDADRPGRPQGGEAQGLRALFATLEQRYTRV